MNPSSANVYFQTKFQYIFYATVEDIGSKGRLKKSVVFIYYWYHMDEKKIWEIIDNFYLGVNVHLFMQSPQPPPHHLLWCWRGVDRKVVLSSDQFDKLTIRLRPHFGSL